MAIFFYQNKRAGAAIAAIYIEVDFRVGMVKCRTAFSTGHSYPVAGFRAQKAVGRSIDALQMNDILEKYRSRAKNLVFEYQSGRRVFSPETFKGAFFAEDEKHVAPTKKPENWREHFDRFIQYHRDKKSAKGFCYSLATLGRHLDGFQKKHGRIASFYDFDISFHARFKGYLHDLTGRNGKMMINTVEGYIHKTKMFLDWCVSSEITDTKKHKHKAFKRLRSKNIPYTFTEERLQEIEAKELNDPGHELVRDWFLLACEISYRYDDYKTLTRESIIPKKIKGRTVHEIVGRHHKNDQPVLIPVSPRALRILQKYDFEMPAPYANQTHNEYIKTICDDPKVTTHTARRTFVTINLRRGISPRLLMSITGHRTEQQLYDYCGITFIENADLMRAFFETDLDN